MSIEEKLARVRKVRETIEEVKSEKQKISGKLEIQKTTLKELEEECKNKYNVEIDKLESLADDLKKEADTLLKEAEEALGM